MRSARAIVESIDVPEPRWLVELDEPLGEDIEPPDDDDEPLGEDVEPLGEDVEPLGEDDEPLGVVVVVLLLGDVVVVVLLLDGVDIVPEGDVVVPLEGDVTVPDVPLPDGEVVLPEGDVIVPDELLPEGVVLLPEGDVVEPDVLLPEGVVLEPEVPPGVVLPLPDGDVVLPEGEVLLPEGEVLLPDVPLPGEPVPVCAMVTPAEAIKATAATAVARGLSFFMSIAPVCRWSMDQHHLPTARDRTCKHCNPCGATGVPTASGERLAKQSRCNELSSSTRGSHARAGVDPTPPRPPATEPSAMSTKRPATVLKQEPDRRPESTTKRGTAPAVLAAAHAARKKQPVKLPAQHLPPDGQERDLELAPRFMADGYAGSGKLEGFAALITGGDSGIGRAVAVLFAREGADVAVVYRQSHDDATLTKACIEAEGRRALLLQGDVRDDAFCRRAVARVMKTFGRLDVLVNNAAIQHQRESLDVVDDAAWIDTVNTNLGGYLRMARAALPHLPRGGSIVNTGSVTGLEGSAHLIDYAATKGAIHAFTKSLASSLLPRGIRVNAVAPGPVWTPLNAHDKPADKVASFGRASDMKRAAQPEELSPAYVFLAAPSCSAYITGLVLPITGSVGAI